METRQWPSLQSIKQYLLFPIHWQLVPHSEAAKAFSKRKYCFMADPLNLLLNRFIPAAGKKSGAGQQHLGNGPVQEQSSAQWKSEASLVTERRQPVHSLASAKGSEGSPTQPC